MSRGYTHMKSCMDKLIASILSKRIVLLVIHRRVKATATVRPCSTGGAPLRLAEFSDFADVTAVRRPREVSPGDVVFSFCETRIKAVGAVTGATQTGPKPDFGAAGANWSREDWFVPVACCVLNNQIRPQDHVPLLRPALPAKYSPLQES
jgi:hypothetical protein